MLSVQVQNSIKCRHSNLAAPQGLTLVTIGDSLGTNDGAATALCDTLPEADLKDVCRFDLGSYTGFLAACLSGHKTAIIIDSTSNGTAPGTISLVDLSAVLDRAWPINIQSCHGLLLAEELRLAKNAGRLPKRIVFFGIELSELSLTNKQRPKLPQSLSQSVKKLALLVSKVLVTLKRDA